MVLHTRGRVGSRRFLKKKPFGPKDQRVFCFLEILEILEILENLENLEIPEKNMGPS